MQLGGNSAAKRGRSFVIECPRGLKPAARGAFSLLELMLVLGLLALMAFMVVPSFRSPLARS